VENLHRSLSRVVRRRPAEIAAWVGLALLLVFAARTLSRSPCLGVADNGDFWRVMRPAGIEHTEPLTTPGRFVRCSFATGEAHLGRGFSSSALLAWIAKHLGRGMSPEAGTMNLRQMGLLYLLLAALVVTIAVDPKRPPLLAAVVGYLLVDPGFLLFFNSFYADSALFIALVGITLCFERWADLGRVLRETSRARWAAIACLLAALIALGGFTKGQYLLMPAAAGATLIAVLVVERSGRPLRVALLIGPVVILSLVAPWHFTRGSGHRFPWANNYHALYGGILAVSESPNLVFDAFDVPEEHRDLPRSDVFSAQIGPTHPVHRHLRGLSRAKLARLYLGDPGALLRVASRIHTELASVETHLRGNHIRDAGHPRRSQYRVWWQYSRLRGLVFGTWPPVVWLVLGGGVLWLVLSFGRRRSSSWTAILFLLLWTCSQFVVVILGDGLVSLKQHLIGARLGLDLLLILLLFDLCRTIPRRVNRKGAKVAKGAQRESIE
jgi:hypothetical protein